MARNTEKYYYVYDLALPRNQVLTHLLEEVQRRGGVPLATHILDLLVDRDDFLYGKNGEKGLWIPRGLLPSPSLGGVQTSPLVVPQREEEKEVQQVNEAGLEANLDAFSSLFRDEDDDDRPTEKMRAVP